MQLHGILGNICLYSGGLQTDMINVMNYTNQTRAVELLFTLYSIAVIQKSDAPYISTTIAKLQICQELPVYQMIGKSVEALYLAGWWMMGCNAGRGRGMSRNLTVLFGWAMH